MRGLEAVAIFKRHHRADALIRELKCKGASRSLIQNLLQFGPSSSVVSFMESMLESPEKIEACSKQADEWAKSRLDTPVKYTP